MFAKASQYAIRSVLYLAIHGQPENRIGVQEISDALEVPKPFLSKILQQLAKNRLISSTKGPTGGFFLSEDNLDNALIQIIECIEGKDPFKGCILGLPECSSQNPCPLHTQTQAFRQGLNFQLRHQSIRDLAVQIQKGRTALLL